MPPGRTSAAAVIQRRSVSSPARRSARDEQRPAVEQQRGAVAALGDRLGAGRGDDEVGPVGHVGEHPVAAAGAHRRAGERPAELLGGAAGADDDRAQLAVRRSAGSASRRPGGRTSGSAATAPRAGAASGPEQIGQRAGVRSRAQASAGT